MSLNHRSMIIAALCIAMTFALPTSDSKDNFNRQMKKMFREIDADNDKKLTLSEITIYYRNTDVDFTDEQLKEAFDQMDSNYDAFINRNEFRDFLQHQFPDGLKVEGRGAFLLISALALIIGAMG